MFIDRRMRFASGPARAGRYAVILAAALMASGCSIKTLAVKTVANTLSQPGDTFTRDDDPELVRAALPFGLKTFESLLESVPNHEPLLVATCSGFTSYAYAFVETDADILGEADHDKAKALREQALKLYIRAKAYCLRAMEVRFKGIGARLLDDPAAALQRARKKDVPLLYWMAASWGAAISLGLDRPELAIDFPTVRALADRALALDEAWNKGSLHELMISLDSLPEAMGGLPARVGEHFKRAVELQQGLSPGPYVSLAAHQAVAAQDRAEYERLLNLAIAIDPEKDKSNRLITIITQRRARAMLQQIDTKFVK